METKTRAEFGSTRVSKKDCALFIFPVPITVPITVSISGILRWWAAWSIGGGSAVASAAALVVRHGYDEIGIRCIAGCIGGFNCDGVDSAIFILAQTLRSQQRAEIAGNLPII